MMFKTEHDIIAALRMLFSREQLVTLTKVFIESGKRIDNADSLVKEKYYRDKELILELKKYTELSKEELSATVKDWFLKHDRLPVFIALKDVGAFAVAKHASQAEGLATKWSTFLYNSDVKRMTNKVVIITGGAQGFGAGIAESFFREGANVVIADLNLEIGIKLVDVFNNSDLPNKALFVQTDVSDFKSVENLINETILHFGGLDVMISNAGILRAGGLDEMTPESFAIMTKVNYEGYFNCAKAASKIMTIQAEFTNKYYFDIIQINSKSGLKGSNKNFAYAGGKFGGIGLTQSFALELMPHRIKVNSICPGNFFDGPLWSHPETGLFVQYLKAGKVPGAKSLADVKTFYEQQVPAGRGCETEDVAKAAFYAIEQEYETGQAIPVTGGQIMLH